MKRFTLCMCAVLSLASILAGCGGSKPVAARVNKDLITEEEFYNRACNIDGITLGNSIQQGGPTRAGELAMQALISERLVIQLATEKQALPSEAEINRYVTFAKKYPNLKGSLGMNPLRTDEEWRREARISLALRNLALKPLNITPEEVQKVFDERVKSQLASLNLEPDQYHLRLIDIKDRSKAQKALDSLNKGVPFETVALTQSEDPNSQPKSGDIGMVPAPQIPAPILNAIKNLKPGEYTKKLIQADVPARGAAPNPVGVPVETRYFLAQLVEKKQGRVPTLEEVRPLVEMLILEQKDRTANQRVQQIIAEFVRKADIQINLKQYQDIVKRLKTPASRPGAGAPPPPGAPPAGSSSAGP